MNMYNNNTETRLKVVQAMQQLVVQGLTRGKSGNVSVLTDEGMLITPTGIAPEHLQPEQVVLMQLDGVVAKGQLTPSSEWQMHADVYINKVDTFAVVHCHSMYATILACAHKRIPAFHYMVAEAGGDEIPLADYATFGTAELSQANFISAKKHQCLFTSESRTVSNANDLTTGIKLASLVEELAQSYWGTLAIGGPVVLQDQEMASVTAAFSHYGQQQSDS